MMTINEMKRCYLAYLECLKDRDWAALGQFVAEDVVHNGKRIWSLPTRI